jgi:hypothetical protein
MPFNWDQPLTFAEWEMDDPAMAQSVKEAVEGVVADMWSEGLGSDEDYDDVLMQVRRAMWNARARRAVWRQWRVIFYSGRTVPPSCCMT